LLLFFHATASFSLTPCFSWVLQANYVNSTALAVCRSDREKPLKRFTMSDASDTSLKRGVNETVQA
jgi:hypothetical protein